MTTKNTSKMLDKVVGCEVMELNEIGVQHENEITFEQFDKQMWEWEMSSKNVVLSIDEPIFHSQVLENFSCRIFDDILFMDGERTMASCFGIDRKKINCIVKETDNRNGQDRIKIFANNGIQISLSILNASPKTYTRRKMQKAFDGGKM